MIGPAFLVTPVIQQNALSVEGYFPESYWYDYYNGTLITEVAKTIRLDAPIDYIPLHIRGGYIIPTQEPANTTVFSREKPFGLIVAPDMNGEAKGDLFYDDGEAELDRNQFYRAFFILRKKTLKMHVEKNNYLGMNIKVLNTIRIFVPNPNLKLNFIVNNVGLVSDENIFYRGKM